MVLAQRILTFAAYEKAELSKPLARTAQFSFNNPLFAGLKRVNQ